ncbi:hypothetical protein RJT34_29866 [Clitoria ternatea]|uniref:Uncharacterized protein n=1 Tax=Clitoria ternatea TaxID=43366 RepID=A0AAN9I3J2_CLITE
MWKNLMMVWNKIEMLSLSSLKSHLLEFFQCHLLLASLLKLKLRMPNLGGLSLLKSLLMEKICTDWRPTSQFLFLKATVVPQLRTPTFELPICQRIAISESCLVSSFPSSPTFVASLHSNSLKKVLETRKRTTKETVTCSSLLPLLL